MCFEIHQVMGYIAKGSFGPILKVKDKAKQKTYAVKVSLLPESHIWNLFIWVIKAMNDQSVYSFVNVVFANTVIYKVTICRPVKHKVKEIHCFLCWQDYDSLKINQKFLFNGQN